jgi:hypothetical protein
MASPDHGNSPENMSTLKTLSVNTDTTTVKPVLWRTCVKECLYGLLCDLCECLLGQEAHQRTAQLLQARRLPHQRKPAAWRQHIDLNTGSYCFQ